MFTIYNTFCQIKNVYISSLCPFSGVSILLEHLWAETCTVLVDSPMTVYIFCVSDIIHNFELVQFEWNISLIFVLFEISETQ